MSKQFLLLCNRPAPNANATTISHHIDAIKQMPGWTVREVSMLGSVPKEIELDRFDCIGIHYTLHLSEPGNYFFNEAAINRIAAFKGLKCIWLHDEYRRVDAVVKILKRLGIDVIFSLADGKTLEHLYPTTEMPEVRKETVLAGYVQPRSPEDWTPDAGIAGRSIDVGYRARRPPYWLGSLGQEKIEIGLGFLHHAAGSGLVLDISVEESERLYGVEWQSFLSRCKAVLCVESGASVIDFSGELERAVTAACDANPELKFQQIQQQYLADVDGALSINPISPRVFESAAAGAVMICFPSRYSGIMRPWQHYIPLARDFSNLDEVKSALKNAQVLHRIARDAYRDLVLPFRFSYMAFARFCSKTLSDEYSRRLSTRHPAIPYTDQQFSSASRGSVLSALSTRLQKTLQRLLLGSKLRGPMIRLWYWLPNTVRSRIRPLLRVIAR